MDPTRSKETWVFMEKQSEHRFRSFLRQDPNTMYLSAAASLSSGVAPVPGALRDRKKKEERKVKLQSKEKCIPPLLSGLFKRGLDSH